MIIWFAVCLLCFASAITAPAEASVAMKGRSGQFMALDQKKLKTRTLAHVPTKKVSKRAGFMALGSSNKLQRLKVQRRGSPKRSIEKLASLEENAIIDLFGDSEIDASHPFFNSVGERHSWPLSSSVKQRISSGYGMRSDPFTSKQAFHAGIDIAAAEGTPVKATASGTVVGTGVHKRLGQYVKIEHGGNLTTQYGHLSKVSVSEGDKVRRGQMIGKVGSTGRSTGAHLDYSVRRSGEVINPMSVLAIPTKLKTLELSANSAQ